jgi:hypothetical protein
MSMMKCPYIPATLFLDGQEIASGEAILEEPLGQNTFWPHDQILQDNFPDQRTTLRLSGKSDSIQLTGFRQCKPMTTREHYHFQIQERA